MLWHRAFVERWESLMRRDVEYTDNLFGLMQAKVEVLQQLCELARQQGTLTQSGDATLLLNFLARKQPLMDRLVEIQELLSPYADDDPESRVWRTAQWRQACRESSQLCQQLLGEIVLLEKQSLDEMSLRRDALAAQLEDGRDGSLAAQAYQAAESLEGGSLDLTCGG